MSDKPQAGEVWETLNVRYRYIVRRVTPEHVEIESERYGHNLSDTLTHAEFLRQFRRVTEATA